jgi:hypothetical protein
VAVFVLMVLGIQAQMSSSSDSAQDLMVVLAGLLDREAETSNLRMFR